MDAMSVLEIGSDDAEVKAATLMVRKPWAVSQHCLQFEKKKSLRAGRNAREFLILLSGLQKDTTCPDVQMSR